MLEYQQQSHQTHIKHVWHINKRDLTMANENHRVYSHRLIVDILLGLLILISMPK